MVVRVRRREVGSDEHGRCEGPEYGTGEVGEVGEDGNESHVVR